MSPTALAAGKGALGVLVSRQRSGRRFLFWLRSLTARRLQLIAFLLAGLLTTGAQWDAVQVLAWARMTVQSLNAGTAWEAALADTFSGELCEICEAVDEARQAQHSPAGAATTPKGGKLLLAVYPAADELIFSEVSAVDVAGRWSLSDQVGRSIERGAPPAPPPKSQGLV
ncbi:hypothetical protein AXK12_08180 [Cephaloticoccus capnophilus]|uniref:Uncharacterized protein n=1 Tax=Cephaloticoccus capnophilus TaxID=1548208 RepID=A0A139SHJ2_9BACT|nr:hypothetical protein [Cephaloticoccus capnophilus]KXU34003.1 hypothetical protein AXK12_08180 [Cephaloticoccus capnophilus]